MKSIFPMPYSDRRLLRTFSAFHPSQGSLFTQRTIHTKERKWKVILAHSSDGGAPSIQVPKMVTIMCVITTKINDNLTALCIGTQ